MHPALARNQYIVKQHVGLFKAASNYDIFDPDQPQTPVLLCREPHLGAITKLLRFTDWSRYTAFDVHVTTPTGEQVLNVKRGFSLLGSKVDVLNETGTRLGGFKQKFFSLKAAFTVLGPSDQAICKVQGSWRGRDFTFEMDGVVYARVKSKWTGLAQELFTTADTYLLSISEEVAPDNPVRTLILGAVLCIDKVLKE